MFIFKALTSNIKLQNLAVFAVHSLIRQWMCVWWDDNTNIKIITWSIMYSLYHHLISTHMSFVVASVATMSDTSKIRRPVSKFLPSCRYFYTLCRVFEHDILTFDGQVASKRMHTSIEHPLAEITICRLVGLFSTRFNPINSGLCENLLLLALGDHMPPKWW